MSVRRGSQQHVTSYTIPAPMGGIDATAPMSNMGAQSCIFAVNILPEDFGMEVRDGYVEWANGWTGGFAKTVITFEGNSDADDRLWVANREGIWDVTIKGTTSPVQDVAFPSTLGNAGICSYVTFGNDEGDRFILLCDGENGYYTWTQTTDTWDKIVEGGGGITGVDPAEFNFVMIWKSHTFFVQRETGKCWFILRAEGFLGTAKPFNFGSQFRFGGPLVSLHNWTLDGGRGIDDYLVGISGAGDVIIYQGTDITDASSFGLVGSWYVGEVPAGNRIASEFSGELYILSVQGLLSMSMVLNGANSADPSTYVTKNIGPYLRNIMDDTFNDFGWHVHIHPKQSLLYLNTPPRLALPQEAFTLYFGTNAWGQIRDLSKSHTANWRSEIYWTDIITNKIFIQQGFVDRVYLDPVADGEPTSIEWQLLTAYSNLDVPTYKRVQYLRPIFVGDGIPSFDVQAVYDFNIFELSGAPPFSVATTALWALGGTYTHSVIADSSDDVYMSFADGALQLTGVTTIDLTIGTQALVVLTWNPANERYEGNSAGIHTYLLSEVNNPLSTTINPDTLPSSLYTLTPVALGDDVGITVPAISLVPPNPAPPVFISRGAIVPDIIFDTNSPKTTDAIWDRSLWAGGIKPLDNPRGATGMGRHIAVNLKGRSSGGVTLMAIDVIYDTGGFM